MPSALEPDLDQLRTWPTVRLSSIGARSVEAMVLRATGFVFLLLFAFQLTGTGRLLIEEYQLGNAIEEISIQHKETLALREEAFSLRSRSQALLALGNIDQMALIDEVSEVLPEAGQSLFSWNYRSSELEFIVDDASPGLEEYVAKLEKIQKLRDIRVDPLVQRKQLKVTASVVRQ